MASTHRALVFEAPLIFTWAAILVLAVPAISQCPNGTGPGEFYGAPMAWQRQTYKPCVDVDGLNKFQLLDDDLPCSPQVAGDEPTCVYHNADVGAYWCPLQVPTCEEDQLECTGFLANETGCDVCFHEEDGPMCWQEYGICRCQQCDCGYNRTGSDCNTCRPSGCDEDCLAKQTVAPGMRYFCKAADLSQGDFSDTGWYGILFTNKIGEAFVTVEMDDVLKVTLHTTMCTSQSNVLVEILGSDCAFRDGALCDNVPRPCFVCTSSAYSIPRSSPWYNTFIGWSLVSYSGVLQYGCDGDCRIGLGMTIDSFLPLPLLVCQSGTRCSMNFEDVLAIVANSTNDTLDHDFSGGSEAGEVSIVVDGGLAVYRAASATILGVGVFLLLCFTVWAWRFRWSCKAGASSKALPQGAMLQWKELSYAGRIKALTGQAKPGTLLGIMGPIGCGKTTLLTCITGRVNPDSGTLLADGEIVTSEQLRGLVGYVPQHERLCPSDTVEEALSFAAAMAGGPASANSVFSRALEAPLLQGKEKAKIGTLSGGQRRLTSIYCELARQPLVLVLDEPTSHLDMNTALAVATELKAISRDVAVITTLHQPRPEIVELLTDIMIIGEGEVRCSMRTTKAQASIVSRLEAQFADTLPQDMSAVDHAIDQVSAGIVLEIDNELGTDASPHEGSTTASGPSTEEPAQTSSTRVVDIDWLVNQEVKAMKAAATMEAAPKAQEAAPAAAEAADTTVAPEVKTAPLSALKAHIGRGRRVSFVYSILSLAIRAVKRQLRGRGYVKVLMTAIMSTALGILFLNMDTNLAGVRNRLGSMSIIHCYIAFQSIGAAERPTSEVLQVEHEVLSKVYLRPAYAFYRVVSLLISQLPHGLLFIIFYLLSGMRTTEDRPVVFLLCLSAVCVASAAIGATLKDTTRSAALVSVMLLFAGFLISNNMIWGDWLLEAIQAISPFRYSYEVLMINEFVGLGTEWNTDAGQGGQELDLYGETWLQNFYLPYKRDDEWSSKGWALGGITLAWLIVAYVSTSLPPECCIENLCLKLWRSVRPGGKDMPASSDGQLMGAAEPSKDQGVVPGGSQPIEPDFPTERLTLNWEISTTDISGVSGQLETGDFHALLGSIGSGKTTLLNALAGRIGGNGVTVLFNGQEVDPYVRRGLVGFVPQSLDNVTPEETPLEAIAFAAAMAGKRAPTPDLLPTKTWMQRIGTMSGGERQLTSIYVELARAPHVLVLDEPTASLDAETALRLAYLLSKVSKSIPVLTTLHQPRPDICALLSHISIMDKGKLVKSNHVDDFATGHGNRVSAAINDILYSGGGPAPQVAQATRMPSVMGEVPRAHRQFGLLRVARREIRRTMSLRSLMLCLLSFIVGLLVGFPYRSMEVTISGVISRIGLFFACNALLGIFAFPRVFDGLRVQGLLTHELQSNISRPWVLCLARLIADLPVRCASAGLFGLAVTMVAPLQSGGDVMGVFVLICILTAIVSSILADACVNLAPVGSANVMFTFLLLILMINGGPFIINFNTFTWALQQSSFFRAAYSRMVCNEFNGQVFKFDPLFEGLSSTEIVAFFGFTDVSGEDWMYYLGIGCDFGLDILALVCWASLFWLLGVIGLVYRTSPRRRAMVVNKID